MIGLISVINRVNASVQQVDINRYNIIIPFSFAIVSSTQTGSLSVVEGSKDIHVSCVHCMCSHNAYSCVVYFGRLSKKLYHLAEKKHVGVLYLGVLSSCFLRPYPLNFLSKQFTHFPQSWRLQASHSPHRALLFNPVRLCK